MGKIQKKKDPRKKKNQADQEKAATAVARPTKRGAANPGLGTMTRNKKKTGAISQRAARKGEDSGLNKYFDTAAQFLREVRVELKKVTWPSRKQTAGSTAVVLVLVIIVSLFLGIVDLGLGKIMQMVLG